MRPPIWENVLGRLATKGQSLTTIEHAAADRSRPNDRASAAATCLIRHYPTFL